MNVFISLVVAVVQVWLTYFDNAMALLQEKIFIYYFYTVA